MTKALIRVSLGIGVAIGGLWYLNKLLASTQFEDITAQISIVFAVSILLGVFVSIKYSEAQWYKRFDQFTKKYLVWVGITLIAGLAIWSIFIK